jgi:hypothetical protein
MAKDAYYFSHDYNARHDPKISALKADYGIEGYGRYWIIIEMLAEQDNYKLKLEGWGIRAIATECQLTAEKMKEFILDCISEFELFKADDQYFWSESLNRRMKIKDEKLEQKRKAGKKGAKARWGSKDKDEEKQKDSTANGTANNSDITKNGKGKERKENEIKSKEINKLSGFGKPDNESGDEFSISQKENGRYDYPEEFEKIYNLYPSQRGTKKSHWRKWAATRRKDIPQETLEKAVKAYAVECNRNGIDEKYIKQLKTFLGPDEHWREYLNKDVESENEVEKQKKLEEMRKKQLLRVEKYG